MSRRFRPTDAFVGESLRGQRYLMVCVLVEARHLTQIRRATASLVGEGKRLHFHQELDSMRRTALELIATMPVRVTVVVCGRRHGVSEFHARDACLAEIVRQLQDRSVPRLTVTSDGKSDVVWIRLPRKRVMSARRRCHASALLRVWHPRSSSHVVRHDGDWRGHGHGQRPSFSSERQHDRVLSHLDVWLHRASWHHRPSTAHGNRRPQRRRDQFRARELTGMCAGNGGQRTD